MALKKMEKDDKNVVQSLTKYKFCISTKKMDKPR